MAVRIQVLGPVMVQRGDDAPETVSGKKVRALLGYLAVESRRHSRDSLAALLWGDMPDDRARHNLRQALSKIRKTVGDVIETETDTIALQCVSDVAEVLTDLQEGRLERALDARELLEGLSIREDGFEDWLRAARRSLRDRTCTAIDHVLSRGELSAEESEALVRRRLSMDVACEAAHRVLMDLLWRSGRRAEAIRQYETCKAALEAELGIEPSAATEELLSAIRSSGERDAPKATPSAVVAVMPFENLASEEDRYFADGISEDIITALSHFRSLTVIARPSSFRFRDDALSPSELGRRLGASFLVQGTVRRAGSRVRVSVTLIDAAAERQLWGERFDRELEDVFAVQDEVTAIVVSTLAGRVEAARSDEARRRPPERLRAHDWVLRGKYHHHLSTAHDCELAIEYFRKAIECDEGYALGHAWLACGLGQAMHFRPDESDALCDQAREAAERGRRLDDRESECHRILAQVFMLRRDFEQAVYFAERSVKLNPNDDRSLAGLGEILAYVGRTADARPPLERAIRVNPYHPDSYALHLARALLHEGCGRDAYDTLSRLSGARLNERAFRTAAAVEWGDDDAIHSASEALRTFCPTFEIERFLSGLCYVHEPSIEQIRGALSRAGFE